MPIAIANAPNYKFYGADIIKYNSLGYLDEYDSDPFTLEPNISNLKWDVIYDGYNSDKLDPYAPKLK